MEVTCEHCKAKLNVPDEKIPKDQIIKIGCPKCKNKITIDTREHAEGKTPQAEGAEESGKGLEEKADGYGELSDDQDLGFLEEGTKLALVMESNSDLSQRFQKAVEELGYKYIPSPNTRDAISKMRLYHFDLVLLAEGFDGQKLEYSPILNYINHLSMSVRRRIFLALVGDKFKTMDNMMAFAMSANLVMSQNDMEKVTAILKKAISDNDRFYKIFFDSLAELGRA
jgi:predicted Zn finger-like uncharacterized protein